jgi:putative acetyltransferase
MNLATYSKSNIEEIKQLFTTVFTASEGQSEGQVIGSLVSDLVSSTNAGDLHGFVATKHGEIIGSIFFSRITFDSSVSAFILSPVAIRTDHQRKGIGQKLINFGINYLKENNVELVFTYGDLSFYSKVGFNLITEEVIKAPLQLTYPEGWLGQSLVGSEIHPVVGNSYCVEALNKPEIW